MKTRPLALLLMLIFGILASAAQTLEQDLEKNYAGKVLILRHPVDKSSQKYDAKGNLLSGGTEGPWTLDGGLQVARIQLFPDKLDIEGRRRLFVYDQSRNAMRPFEVKEKDRPKVRIEIGLDAPLTSVDQADAAIHRVFISNETELIDSAPEYWRSFLIEQYRKPGSDKKAEGEAQQLPTASSPEKPIRLDKAQLQNATPPKAISSPEPDYSSEAKRFNVQGTMVLGVVIDKEGRLTQPRIIRPIGLGLDEKAIAGTRKWKFKPATLNGQPVAVEMAIEISFNLY
jgi:TonB family protein